MCGGFSVLAEKNFRVAENSRLLSILEIYLTIACGYLCHGDFGTGVLHCSVARHFN